ncbi:MAG TPA: hypothetical protein VF688_02010 [Allosphingosinicella sp.]
MSLYLQRLLDRAAALPPRVVSASPLLVAGSPILTFDQRLASAEMAEDFSILGATPDLPEAAEEMPASTRPLVGQDAQGGPPKPLAALEPRADHALPTPRTHPAPRAAPGSALPEFRRAAETGDAAPVMPAQVPGTNAVEPPRPSGPPRLEPDLPPAQPVPVHADADRPSVPFRAPADPSPVPAEAVAEPMAAKAGVSAQAPQPETGPAPTSSTVSEARPQPSAGAAVPQGPHPVEQLTPARPVAAAEPVVAPIPPLAPAPRSLSVGEVERMIDEAIAAERDRSAARQPAAVRTQPNAAPTPSGEAPAKRPATAAQASLIGSLESSRFRPMLFGVRRR